MGRCCSGKAGGCYGGFWRKERRRRMEGTRTLRWARIDWGLFWGEGVLWFPRQREELEKDHDFESRDQAGHQA